MSKEINTPQNDSEEVDLGKLFKLIGNGFQKLFNFIASNFKGLFHYLILIIRHFYLQIKWYALAGFSGLIIGVIADINSDKLYGANMFFNTNFNSGYQVYENIKNLHELTKEGDSVKLAKILGVKTSEAATLKGFYIAPDIDVNEKIRMFDEFYKSLDSITRVETTYTEYVGQLSTYNFKTHRIGVASTDKTIFPKLRENFVQAISENAYLNKLLAVSQKNFDKEIETITKQATEVDGLVEKYLEIRKRESEKEPIPGSGTNLYLGNAQQSELLINEAELIKEKLVFESQIRGLTEAKVRGENIISVLSDFPETGYDIQEWYEKYKFIFPALFIGITILSFIFIGLGRFVNNYKTA
jgi:hypothetical protein